jgi:hypothetical protein
VVRRLMASPACVYTFQANLERECLLQVKCESKLDLSFVLIFLYKHMRSAEITV